MKRLIEFLVLDALFIAMFAFFKAIPGFYLYEPLDARLLFLAWNVASLITIAAFPKMAILPKSVMMMLVFFACVALGKFAMPGRRRIVTFLVFLPLALQFAKRLNRHLEHFLVRLGRSGRVAVFVGATESFTKFAKAFYDSAWKDYEVIRSFSSFTEALEYLKGERADELYCSLAHPTLKEAQALFEYCENHLVRFYGVPENQEYFDRHLTATALGDTTLLTPRAEPLRRLSNRILKRALDIVISLGFLSTLFLPILAVVAYRIKKESPGPIFFRQRRHGLDGKEFKCWKFRSMHVNDQSDTAQTAKDDPRKFPFGDFMRRTNIDELPQFINVLTGEMSVVGPRPHPCKMTDDFGEVVNRYRVRLYAKPGVTGWAQVNGARGAALELGDMIKRVRLDIWYLEHWSFLLDLSIIFRTFYQTIAGKNKNAF